MPVDLWSLYALMLRSRLFEGAISQLWHDGLISGEMHLGTGEEAIVAGVVSHLRDGDAMALDHRGTAALFMRGADPVLILRELLGRPDGLCGGMGGHMHLFSKDLLAASSGIVGAAGPAAAGFAMSAEYGNLGAVAVAFFGEGSMNQGMLLESLNLAAAWNLAVLFVCKDDAWSITTGSDSATGGDLNTRARGLGVPVVEVDGREVSQVWQAAQQALERARAGQGPTFLRAGCVHLEAHLMGYQLLRAVRSPLREMPAITIPLTRSFLHPRGAPFRERMAGLKIVLAALLATMRDPRRDSANDPLQRTRKVLLRDADRLQKLEDRIEVETGDLLESALAEVTL